MLEGLLHEPGTEVIHELGPGRDWRYGPKGGHHLQKLVDLGVDVLITEELGRPTSLAVVPQLLEVRQTPRNRGPTRIAVEVREVVHTRRLGSGLRRRRRTEE